MKTKDIYEAPQLEIIEIESENTIMNGSIEMDTRETDGVARGRERKLWD